MPQLCPSPRELDDLELLMSGALAPQTTFDDVVTLSLPEGSEDDVELVDPEGFALARIVGGRLEALARPRYGPFRRLRLSAEETRALHADALTVPVSAALTETDLADIERGREGRTVVLLALCGVGTPRGLTPVGLVRASLAAAEILGRASVVAVPLPAHGDPDTDRRLAERVVENYATGPVHWPAGAGAATGAVADAVALDQPSEAERGVVVFFTGLSGSGKSTLAQALHDLILESGRRTVTSLDGDVVRRELSAGLTFSRADRETNIRRIGWVAAEIARHHGVAICSPIAPFESTRQSVRAMVEEAGGRFVLVHVSTPLAECERRDRKGLYRRARAGEIPDFTGISSPYEAPVDASVSVDTTGLSVTEALDRVLAVLPTSLWAGPTLPVD